MYNQTKKLDWEEIEQGMINQWYFVQKIMGNLLPAYYPYLTYQGLVECINNDPNFKNNEDDEE
jgi:hypothetical protein